MNTADATLADALERYREHCQQGDPPDPDAFVGGYPAIAEELHHCLDALALLYADRPAVPSQVVGDYRILRELGRGGMGVVYEAEQLSLGRRVALKMLPFAGVLSPRQLQRFRNEALAAAHLDHPNIVSVYSVGSDRGLHHYAMQLVEGLSVAELIGQLRDSDDFSPPVRAVTKDGSVESRAYCDAVARLGSQAARGLQHAHDEGVVHRDIKPGNLLVDASAHLHITDFGLASFRSEPGLTMTGDLLGTVRYMSPEQALALHARIDHRTDIYSLGVTLYELLTLEPAFKGTDPHTLIEAIAERDPVLPHSLNPAIPTELETVVLKAMAKQPGERYSNAAELADDLERFLEDRPVLARRPSLIKCTTKWMHRHRGLVWSAAGALLLAFVGLVIGTILIARERDRAQTHFASARRVIEILLDRLGEAVAYEQLGETQQGVLDEALAFYLAFVASEESRGGRGSPEVARAYAGIGRIHHLRCDHDAAERAYLAALDRPPGDGLRARERLGQLRIDQRRLGQARAEFEFCLGRTDDPATRVRLLMAIGSTLTGTTAVERFEDALRILSGQPATKDVWFGRARCLQSAGRALIADGRPEEGVVYLQRSYQIVKRLAAEHPTDPRHGRLLAELYAAQAEVVQKSNVTWEDEEPEPTSGPGRPRVTLGPDWIQFEASMDTVRMSSAPGGLLHECRGRSNLLGDFDATARVVFLQTPERMFSGARIVLSDRGHPGSTLSVDTSGYLDPKSRGFSGSFVITGGEGRYEGATGTGKVLAIDKVELATRQEEGGVRCTLVGRIRRE